MENFVLSLKSKSRLATCTYDLVNIVELAIKISPIDFSVIWGYRNEKDQNEAYELGHSKVKYPNSDHNILPSNAVDIAPYPIDWEDEIGFALIAGAMFVSARILKKELKWGGKWEILKDLGHFYLL